MRKPKPTRFNLKAIVVDENGWRRVKVNGVTVGRYKWTMNGYYSVYAGESESFENRLDNCATEKQVFLALHRESDKLAS
jgi:hypothetical protein